MLKKNHIQLRGIFNMITNFNQEIPEIFEINQSQLEASELIIVTERVDDIGLLIGQMLKMGLREVLDQHIPTHWKQRELTWGWTVIIWLSYILSEGDHRKISMEAYIVRMQQTLSDITNQKLDSKDFTDDRLSMVLKYLSQPYWKQIEKDLNERTIKVYDLETETVRCDATSVSANHQIVPEGLIQFGHHKDGTIKPQFKIMMAGLDPLGMPLATEVVSGETADDGLYIPIIKRVDQSLNKTGLLYVGDCKISALETRGYIAKQKNSYLSPLPLTGETAISMENWIDIGVEKDFNYDLEFVYRSNDDGSEVLIAAGYEFEREQSILMDDKTEMTWTERVLVIKSLTHAKQQRQGLEKRLTTAKQKIDALTPERGRGKKQITEEEELLAAIDKILKQHKISPEMFDIDYEKQVEKQTKFIGKGRGSKNRAKKIIKKVRFSINSVQRNSEAIEAAKERFGWKAFVSNHSKNKLSLSEAVINYRYEYRVEQIFNRLKNHLNIAPGFVKRKEQITGLTHLLSLGVRVLTLIEYVVRLSLQNDKATLPDLHPENFQKKTNKPTARRLLSAFSNLTLTIIKTSIGEVFRYLTPLSKLHKEILRRLGIDISLYLNLGIVRS